MLKTNILLKVKNLGQKYLIIFNCDTSLSEGMMDEVVHIVHLSDL